MLKKKIEAVFQVKSFNAETGIFEGYANTFDYKDHAGDITQKGAFIKSLKTHAENGTMPALLWQHDMKSPIGVWLEMREDDKGLWAKGQLTKGVRKADEALLLLKAGALRGLSIGYFPEDEEYDPDRKANLLKQVNLLETSLVTFACNDQSMVESVKQRFKHNDTPTAQEVEEALQEMGFSKLHASQIVSFGYKNAFTDLDSKLDEILNVFQK